MSSGLPHLAGRLRFKTNGPGTGEYPWAYGFRLRLAHT